MKLIAILLVILIIFVSGCSQQALQSHSAIPNEKISPITEPSKFSPTSISPSPVPATTKLPDISKSPNPTPDAGYISWQYSDGWKPSRNPPPCPERIIKQTPADINLATSINYPGEIRRGQYKAHGGFGFENSKPDDITVLVPQDGFVVSGARYIQSGEMQYLFDMDHPCGIRYRFDHLLKLSPKFQEIAEKLPEPKVDDTRGTRFDAPVKVQAGEVIASAVGFRNNTNALIGFDFGVYDLRQTNEASKNLIWLQQHGGDQAPYALCWLDLLPTGDREKAKSLPCQGGSFDCKQQSDYCK